ncbi:MAG: ribonuclease Z [Candidatus Micrarchaeaceae archaeon]
MRIKVTILGTSGSTPSKSRGMPSVAISYEGSIYLFDCGEGTQMQMLKYGLNIAKVDAIFITHVHGDHIIGLPGLVRSLSLNHRSRPLSIFVPKGSENVVRNLLSFDKALIAFPILVNGVKAGVVMKNETIAIEAFKLNHTIKTYGYIFRELDRRRFIKKKCKALGIEGKMFSELQSKGSVVVKGKRIGIKSVTWLKKGKRIVYASDTRPTKETVKAAKGADLLIHESTYTENEKKLAVKRKHSTAHEAAEIAKEAGVSRLVLMHISTRHADPHELIKEARIVFRNVIVAHDGSNIFV